MSTKINFYKLYIYFILLIISMENNEEFDNTNDNILKEEKDYNMSDPNDKFFNDICAFYSSKNDKDVSLEYRRSYYYFPHGKRTIISDPNTIKRIFPEPQRNSIFLCFTNIFSSDSIFFIIILYLLVPVFFIQFLLLFIILCGKYKDASKKTQEEYFKYMEKREKIKKYYNLNNFINNYLNDISSMNYINKNGKDLMILILLPKMLIHHSKKKSIMNLME